LRLETGGVPPGGFLPLSEGIVGAGTEFFATVCELGLEEVVAKRLDSYKGVRSEQTQWSMLGCCQPPVAASEAIR